MYFYYIKALKCLLRFPVKTGFFPMEKRPVSGTAVYAYFAYTPTKLLPSSLSPYWMVHCHLTELFGQVP